MKNKCGALQTDRQSIADVFAEFYEDLYAPGAGSAAAGGEHDFEDETGVPSVTVEELRGRLKKMHKKKASDTHGIVVELLQEAGQDMLFLISEVFNDILKKRSTPPLYWK